MRPGFLSPLVMFVLVLAPSRAIAASPQGETVTVGIAAPSAQLAGGVDLSAPLRDALFTTLRGASLPVVVLDSGDMQQAVTEGAQKNCAFVLLTRVTQSRGRLGGGLMSKMSMMKGPKGAIPSTGQPQTGESLAAAEQPVIKGGDTVTLEYRLMPRGSNAPVSEARLESKAQADGEDVLGPLIDKLSNVLSTAVAASPTTRNGLASAPPSGTAAQNANQSNNRRGRSNGRGSANATPPPMNCEQIAVASRGTVTVESCKQFMGVQQGMDAALNDPRASRPGDDRMTCDQIVAEIKQQPIKAPDQAKVAEAQEAGKDLKQTLDKQQKEIAEKAAVDAAEELAKTPERMFLPNAVNAADYKRKEAENDAMSKRIEAEDQPKVEREMTASANLIGDVGQQFADNPRLAKLMQMANTKRCKVQ